MQTFSELATSRREWIDTVLLPWCRQAARKELILAENEWLDIAGRPDAAKTLWYWAWSRFPELCVAELSSLDETQAVTVQLKQGRVVQGFPDARRSQGGQLTLAGPAGAQFGPFSIDDIESVTRTSS